VWDILSVALADISDSPALAEEDILAALPWAAALKDDPAAC
jgi:hypothetical protein